MSNFNRVALNGDSIMFKNLIALAIAGLLLSGCYMVPLAFIGPASSGFTTASIIQSTISTVANHAVKKKTGKTISEHAFDRMHERNNNREIIQQSYLPTHNKSKNKSIIIP
jgi:hypothetical protein